MAFLYRSRKYCQFCVVVFSKVFFPAYRLAFRYRKRYLSQFSPLNEGLISQTENSAPHLNDVSVKSEISGCRLQPFRRKIKYLEFNDLIENYLAQEQSVDKVRFGREILRVMKENEMKMTREHYEALLAFYIDNNETLNFQEFLSDLKSDGIKLDEELFSLLLKCLCLSKQIDNANTLLTKLRENNIPLKEDHYIYMIYGYGKLRNLNKVNELMQEMIDSDVEVSTKTYITVLKVYAENGSLKLLENYYDFLQKNEIQLSEDQVLDVLESLAFSGNFSLMPVVASWRSSYSAEGFRNLVNNLISHRCLEGVINVLTIMKTFFPNMTYRNKRLLQTALSPDFSFDYAISLASQLVERELDPYALHRTLKLVFFKTGDFDCVKILKEMKKLDIEIRIHYFWPIFVKKFEAQGENGLFNSLKLLNTFKLKFDLVTMICIVLPRLEYNNITSEKLVTVTSWPKKLIDFSLCFHLFKLGRISEAAALIKNHECILNCLPKRSWLNYLARAILRSSNPSGWCGVLNALRPSKVDNLLLALTHPSGEYQSIGLVPSCFTSVLEKLNQYKWQISTECYEDLTQNLEGLTPYQKQLLKDMVGNEITDTDHYHDKKAIRTNESNIQDLEGLYKQGLSDEDMTKMLLKKIFFYHCYLGNMRNTLKFKEKLVEHNESLNSTLIQLGLFVAYTRNKDLANSKTYYENFSNQYPDFKIPFHYVLNYCALLAEKGLYKDSLNIIKEKKYKTIWCSSVRVYVVKVMEALGRQNSTDLFKEFIKAFESCVMLDNKTLKPCVMSFVERGDLKSAMEMFKMSALDYQATPALVPLLSLALSENDNAALKTIQSYSLKVMDKLTFMSEMMLAVSKTGDTERLEGILSKKLVRTEILDKLIRKKCLSLTSRLELEGLTNFYLALKEPETKKLVLSCIGDCYEQKLDYEGAENFLKYLEENEDQTVASEFRERIKTFKPD